ncbi:MAG: hypothetical protein IPF48_14130 [Sphingomonadales bacterium]|nr:hypothetical protein [Sphingomonadales bacterium]
MVPFFARNVVEGWRPLATRLAYRRPFDSATYWSLWQASFSTLAGWRFPGERRTRGSNRCHVVVVVVAGCAPGL